MAPQTGTTASAAPAILPNHAVKQSLSSQEDVTRESNELYRPPTVTRDGRSYSGGSTKLTVRGPSYAPSGPPPGSFSSDMKSTYSSRSGTPKLEQYRTRDVGREIEDRVTSNQRHAMLKDQLAKELKIKAGTENMLEVLMTKNAKQTKDQRFRVESELSSSNRKIAELKVQLEDETRRAKRPVTPPANSQASIYRGSPLRSPSQEDDESYLDEDNLEIAEAESPTFILADILQALEMEGMQPDYYIVRANELVELLKRHPNLKYDLVWSVFGLRVQLMLLSDSSEIVGAGYRLTRYVIADQKSLQTIRELHTDELVVLSLTKGSKAMTEREQAMKFVRAFLGVKKGVNELSRAVVRAVVAIAENTEDRLRNMAIMTLAEILIRSPDLLVKSGGMGPLNNALADESYRASQSLTATFVHVLDTPVKRKYLLSGREMEPVLSNFSDAVEIHGSEEKLRSSLDAISVMIKTWPGFITLAKNDGSNLRSLLQSFVYDSPQAHDMLLDFLFDTLRIQRPSWSASFLAGRRLTTYGRVANLQVDFIERQPNDGGETDEENRFDLLGHFTALKLATLLEVGLSKVRYTLWCGSAILT